VPPSGLGLGCWPCESRSSCRLAAEWAINFSIAMRGLMTECSRRKAMRSRTTHCASVAKRLTSTDLASGRTLAQGKELACRVQSEKRTRRGGRPGSMLRPRESYCTLSLGRRSEGFFWQTTRGQRTGSAELVIHRRVHSIGSRHQSIKASKEKSMSDTIAVICAGCGATVMRHPAMRLRRVVCLECVRKAKSEVKRARRE
jgi:hypothetical protein